MNHPLQWRIYNKNSAPTNRTRLFRFDMYVSCRKRTALKADTPPQRGLAPPPPEVHPGSAPTLGIAFVKSFYHTFYFKEESIDYNQLSNRNLKPITKRKQCNRRKIY